MPSACPHTGVALSWVGGINQLAELLAASDVVVVTAPLDASTRGMIGAAEFAAMKPMALLINVARGPVVDQHALFENERRQLDGQVSGSGLHGHSFWQGHVQAGAY
jgi:phosphoglycerate dehydrogenase-like enzyme